MRGFLAFLLLVLWLAAVCATAWGVITIASANRQIRARESLQTTAAATGQDIERHTRALQRLREQRLAGYGAAATGAALALAIPALRWVRSRRR